MDFIFLGFVLGLLIPRVTDKQANVFLDAVSGLWCASLGFNPERLRKAASDQMGRLGYYHSFMGQKCDVTGRLAERLVEKLPDSIEHVFFGTSGWEAVENAVKFARCYQIDRGKHSKTRIIARNDAYHGSGSISAALTGMSYCHDGFDVPTSQVIRTGRAHFLADAHDGESESDFVARRVSELDAQIIAEGPETICAFIGEPLMGSGGVFLPPQGNWQGVQDVLRKHDILLIADGISEHAHRLGTFGHGVTYGGHPVGAAVALETLAIYDEMDLPEHVQSLGAQLTSRLEPIKSMQSVGDIRSIGLVAGVEFTENRAPDLVRARECPIFCV